MPKKPLSYNPHAPEFRPSYATLLSVPAKSAAVVANVIPPSTVTSAPISHDNTDPSSKCRVVRPENSALQSRKKGGGSSLARMRSIAKTLQRKREGRSATTQTPEAENNAEVSEIIDTKPHNAHYYLYPREEEPALTARRAVVAANACEVRIPIPAGKLIHTTERLTRLHLIATLRDVDDATGGIVSCTLQRSLSVLQSWVTSMSREEWRNALLAKDRWGNRPLQLTAAQLTAAGTQHCNAEEALAIMEFMLGEGADPSLANNKGLTALHHAALALNLDALHLLLDQHVRISAANEDSDVEDCWWTHPIHFAIMGLALRGEQATMDEEAMTERVAVMEEFVDTLLTYDAGSLAVLDDPLTIFNCINSVLSAGIADRVQGWTFDVLHRLTLFFLDRGVRVLPWSIVSDTSVETTPLKRFARRTRREGSPFHGLAAFAAPYCLAACLRALAMTDLGSAVSDGSAANGHTGALWEMDAHELCSAVTRSLTPSEARRVTTLLLSTSPASEHLLLETPILSGSLAVADFICYCAEALDLQELLMAYTNKSGKTALDVACSPAFAGVNAHEALAPDAPSSARSKPRDFVARLLRMAGGHIVHHDRAGVPSPLAEALNHGLFDVASMLLGAGYKLDSQCFSNLHTPSGDVLAAFCCDSREAVDCLAEKLLAREGAFHVEPKFSLQRFIWRMAAASAHHDVDPYGVFDLNAQLGCLVRQQGCDAFIHCTGSPFLSWLQIEHLSARCQLLADGDDPPSARQGPSTFVGQWTDLALRPISNNRLILHYDASSECIESKLGVHCNIIGRKSYFVATALQHSGASDAAATIAVDTVSPAVILYLLYHVYCGELPDLRGATDPLLSLRSHLCRTRASAHALLARFAEDTLRAMTMGHPETKAVALPASLEALFLVDAWKVANYWNEVTLCSKLEVLLCLEIGSHSVAALFCVGLDMLALQGKDTTCFESFYESFVVLNVRWDASVIEILLEQCQALVESHRGSGYRLIAGVLHWLHMHPGFIVASTECCMYILSTELMTHDDEVVADCCDEDAITHEFQSKLHAARQPTPVSLLGGPTHHSAEIHENAIAFDAGQISAILRSAPSCQWLSDLRRHTLMAAATGSLDRLQLLAHSPFLHVDYADRRIRGQDCGNSCSKSSHRRVAATVEMFGSFTLGLCATVADDWYSLLDMECAPAERDSAGFVDTLVKSWVLRNRGCQQLCNACALTPWERPKENMCIDIVIRSVAEVSVSRLKVQYIPSVLCGSLRDGCGVISVTTHASPAMPSQVQQQIGEAVAKCLMIAAGQLDAFESINFPHLPEASASINAPIASSSFDMLACFPRGVTDLLFILRVAQILNLKSVSCHAEVRLCTCLDYLFHAQCSNVSRCWTLAVMYEQLRRAFADCSLALYICRTYFLKTVVTTQQDPEYAVSGDWLLALPDVVAEAFERCLLGPWTDFDSFERMLSARAADRLRTLNHTDKVGLEAAFQWALT